MIKPYVLNYLFFLPTSATGYGSIILFTEHPEEAMRLFKSKLDKDYPSAYGLQIQVKELEQNVIDGIIETQRIKQ